MACAVLKGADLSIGAADAYLEHARLGLRWPLDAWLFHIDQPYAASLREYSDSSHVLPHSAKHAQHSARRRAVRIADPERQADEFILAGFDLRQVQPFDDADVC